MHGNADNFPNESVQNLHKAVKQLLISADASATNSTGAQLFSSTTDELDSPYLLQVLTRALLAFYGSGPRGIELAVKECGEIPAVWRIFLARLQLRKWEPWHQGRGHGLLEETKLDFRRFRLNSDSLKLFQSS